MARCICCLVDTSVHNFISYKVWWRNVFTFIEFISASFSPPHLTNSDHCVDREAVEMQRDSRIKIIAFSNRIVPVQFDCAMLFFVITRKI